MAARFVSIDRETPLLLPPDMRQWVPENHLSHAKVSMEWTLVCSGIY